MTHSQQRAEALAQEILLDLLHHGHTTVAADLRMHLAAALQADVTAITQLQAMASVRWLGDLSIESVPLRSWYQKLDRFRRQWKRVSQEARHQLK
jgi:hypothetical protein